MVPSFRPLSLSTTQVLMRPVTIRTGTDLRSRGQATPGPRVELDVDDEPRELTHLEGGQVVVQHVVRHTVAEAARGPVLVEDGVLGVDRVDLAQPLDRRADAVVQRDRGHLALAFFT